MELVRNELAEVVVSGRAVGLRRLRQFAVGVDVGQAHDPTAICIASEVSHRPEWPQLTPRLPDEYRRPRIEVHHLERLPLGMAYTKQVEHIADLMRRDPLVRLRPSLLIDYTGVGRPVMTQ